MQLFYFSNILVNLKLGNFISVLKVHPILIKVKAIKIGRW